MKVMCIHPTGDLCGHIRIEPPEIVTVVKTVKLCGTYPTYVFEEYPLTTEGEEAHYAIKNFAPLESEISESVSKPELMEA